MWLPVSVSPTAGRGHRLSGEARGGWLESLEWAGHVSFAKALNPFCNLVFGGGCGSGENMPQQMVNTGNRSHGNTADPDFSLERSPLPVPAPGPSGCLGFGQESGPQAPAGPRPWSSGHRGQGEAGAGQERLFWMPLVDSALHCSGEWGRARAKPGPAAQLGAHACSPGGRERSGGCGSGV